MSRLSTLGHGLYDRVFHRGEASRSAVPESVDDTATTLRMSRAGSNTDGHSDARDRSDATRRAEARAALNTTQELSEDDLEVASDLARDDDERRKAAGDLASDSRVISDEVLLAGADLGDDVVTTVGTEVKDGGDLYGIHVPPASDRAQLDDDHAFAGGQNWIESLEERAIEGGPEPEHELDIVDENDGPSNTDSKDRPVADRGSAGPRGL